MYDLLELDDDEEVDDLLELDDGVGEGVYDLFDEEELGVYELLDRAELDEVPVVARLDELDTLDELRVPDDEPSLYICLLPLLGLLYV